MKRADDCRTHPSGAALEARLDIVLLVIYLLFNEGYNSQKSDELIRKDLCVEAIRLCFLLTEHAAGKKPVVFALLSLMCFQASRFESRMENGDTIILLQHQDRSRWDQNLIGKGYQFLNHSAGITAHRVSYRVCHCSRTCAGRQLQQHQLDAHAATL